jgi:hypothetical protein
MQVYEFLKELLVAAGFKFVPSVFPRPSLRINIWTEATPSLYFSILHYR